MRGATLWINLIPFSIIRCWRVLSFACPRRALPVPLCLMAIQRHRTDKIPKPNATGGVRQGPRQDILKSEHQHPIKFLGFQEDEQNCRTIRHMIHVEDDELAEELDKFMLIMMGEYPKRKRGRCKMYCRSNYGHKVFNRSRQEGTRKLYHDYFSAHGMCKRSQQIDWRLHQYHLQNINSGVENIPCIKEQCV